MKGHNENGCFVIFDDYFIMKPWWIFVTEGSVSDRKWHRSLGSQFYYDTLQKAFERLAKTAALLSKSLFEFVHGAANIWEVHSAGLQRTEHQLQDYLEEVSKNYEEKNQVRLITCVL